MRIPKTGNILIPQIEKKIEKKLKELQLRPEISPKEFLEIHGVGKHRYFSPCQTKEGIKIGFYSRLHFNLDTKNKFTREIKLLLKFKESNLEIKKFVPQIIDFGIEKNFEWFEREFPLGKPLGQSRELLQKLNLKSIPKIVEIIFKILKIPPHFLPEIKKFKVEDYLGKGIYSGLVNEGLLEGNLANSIQNFIKKNLSLLKKENKYFVHGDLNLGNIISDKTNIWLIDWELIHLNNFVYDIGYLWAHLWQAKRQFRQNLISIFLKKISGEELKKFKIFFPTVASFLALGGIKFQEGKKAENEIRKKFYSQIFENFSNFEKLIKL